MCLIMHLPIYLTFFFLSRWYGVNQTSYMLYYMPIIVYLCTLKHSNRFIGHAHSCFNFKRHYWCHHSLCIQDFLSPSSLWQSRSHSDVYWVRGGRRYNRPLATCSRLGPNSSLKNITVHKTLTINNSLSIELSTYGAWLHFQQASLSGEPLINFRSHRLNWPSHSGAEESSQRYEQHVSGDLGLCFRHLGVGAGVLHLADGLLEGVFTWWDSYHHSYLLVQSVEELCHWFNWSQQLQRLCLDAGSGWSALISVLIGWLDFLLLAGHVSWPF